MDFFLTFNLMILCFLRIKYKVRFDNLVEKIIIHFFLK